MKGTKTKRIYDEITVSKNFLFFIAGIIFTCIFLFVLLTISDNRVSIDKCPACESCIVCDTNLTSMCTPLTIDAFRLCINGDKLIGLKEYSLIMVDKEVSK